MIAFLSAIALSLLLLAIFISLRIYIILPHRRLTPPTSIPQSARIIELTPLEKSHVLFILGSGGHTAEMFSMIQDITPEMVTHRTYLFSSGDTHSASKAVKFEERLTGIAAGGGGGKGRKGGDGGEGGYRLLEIPRARRVKQSWLTTPWTCLVCLMGCLGAVSGTDVAVSAAGKKEQERWKGKEYPDVIVCNGPATGVMVVAACYLFKFFGLCKTRVIYVESFARVATLSLSGKLLLPLADRFLVQWPQLAEKYPAAEHIGFLVS
ncbi:hypothetical protein ABW19_dt0210085 [Dactylella cylindrospora]|nr:hypothetical protein ABW19_dt0210085 [Dactylella cylindrospora]